MLVRDSHDDSHRDEKHTGDGQREEQSIPGQMNRVAIVMSVLEMERGLVREESTYYSTV